MTMLVKVTTDTVVLALAVTEAAAATVVTNAVAFVLQDMHKPTF